MKRTAINWLLYLALLLPLPGFGQSLDEAATAERLQQLLHGPVGPAERAWVTSLLTYQEDSRRPHPERDSLSLPRFGIRALAHAVQRQWQIRDALQALRETPSKRHAPAKDPIQAEARARWLSQADAPALARFRASTTVAHLDEPALRVLLRRSARLVEWQQLARVGKSRQAMEWLSIARRELPGAAYAEVLQLASANPALASHAARLRGELARSEPAARQALLQQLRHDPLRREWIEAALTARLRDLELILSRRLAQADQAALAAWGLWQLDTDSARQQLQDYLGRPDALPHLREELTRWLD